MELKTKLYKVAYRPVTVFFLLRRLLCSRVDRVGYAWQAKGTQPASRASWLETLMPSGSLNLPAESK